MAHATVPPLVIPMLTLSRTTRSLVLAAAAVTVAACSSDSAGTAPELEARGNTLTAGTTAKVLLRTEVQTTTESGSLTITPKSGGRIVLPKSGLTVTVPAGAITSGSMTIVVTSRPGKAIGYDFEPHGAKFAKALTFSQSLTGTTWAALAKPMLFGVYHTAPVNTTANSVMSAEVLNTRLVTDAKTKVVSSVFDIRHFSGYVLSTGRADEVGGSSLGM
jgi:hypothetical protein